MAVSASFFCQAQDHLAPGTAEETETSAAALTATQQAIEGDWTDSKEVNTVEQSELTRKMKQAQKAKDASTYDKYGGGITIMSMLIVVSALAILSILFLAFGKISSLMLSKRKKEAVAKKMPEADTDDHSLDTGDVIAAIAAALSEHFNADHDIEDTILTIRRMKKAYSPWNSKIYNMRHVPEHVHNPALNGKTKR